MRTRKAARQPGKIVAILERWIDQDETAPLGRRHIGVERDPAVDRNRLGAPVAREIARQRLGGRRLDFAGDETILRTQEGPHDHGRPRIAHEVSFRIRICRIETADDVKIRRQQHARRLAQWRRQQARNAGLPFGTATGFRPRKIIKPCPRMGVDHAESGGLRAKLHEDAHQHGMLGDIRKAAGMEGVAIVQPRKTLSRLRLVDQRMGCFVFGVPPLAGAFLAGPK